MDWLPPIFDLDGRARPFDMDPAWFAETRTLIERRHAALTRQLAEEGWFDPVLPQEAPEIPEDAEDDGGWRAMPEHSRVVGSWVAGFQYALTLFTDLDEQVEDEEAISLALDRLFRHLPPESDEQRAAAALVQAEHPVANLEEAVGDLVSAVAELWEITSVNRYKVDTVRRDAPKVGRNDPCPCGSGKKFKQCHGR